MARLIEQSSYLAIRQAPVLRIKVFHLIPPLNLGKIGQVIKKAPNLLELSVLTCSY
jgi:hypothetical protein